MHGGQADCASERTRVLLGRVGVASVFGVESNVSCFCVARALDFMYIVSSPVVPHF